MGDSDRAPDSARIRQGIVYAAPGGTALRLTLFQPPGDPEGELRPGIVLVHGGAWLTGTRHQMRWYGRHFAQSGYVAVSIEYRKMPRHPFPRCLHDVKSAVRWMRRFRKELRLDPGRIGICGNSAGGHLAALVASTAGLAEFEGSENAGHASAVQAAISMYGALDLRVYNTLSTWIRAGGISRRYVEQFIGARYRDGEGPFLNASPVGHFGPDTAPMMFVHGDRDNLVPVNVSCRAAETLRDYGTPAEFLCVNRRGHAFDHMYPRDRRMVFHQMRRFMDTHLIGDTAAVEAQPALADAEARKPRNCLPAEA